MVLLDFLLFTLLPPKARTHCPALEAPRIFDVQAVLFVRNLASHAGAVIEFRAKEKTRILLPLRPH